ncbi:MAG: HRDC domain-containing protein [Bellilinea sp.]
MMEPPNQPPVMVDQVKDLNNLVHLLENQPRVAVDTESNSLFAYMEQVCLIQFSIPGSDFMVDPIALPDLSPLAKLFSDPKIEKIFHAAEYDLICLKRDFNFEFNSVFDTMQAARILGRTNVGLAGMLESEFGVIIEKKFQRANWGERPLTTAMLAYARLDSYYLIDLRDRLYAELVDKGLLALALEDFRRVTRVDAGSTELEPPAWWRLPGNQSLNPQQCSVLQALVEYRDQQARRADLPHFKVLSNQTLLQIAEELPLTWDALADIPSLSARQRDRHYTGLLAAVKRRMDNPPPPRPVNHRRSDAVLERLEILRDWRKETARKLEVESDVVLPREVLEEIAVKAPATQGDLRILMQELPWRFEQYGSRILAAIHQKEPS